MTESYIQPCRHCGFAIEMSDKAGRMLPYDQDGKQHFCNKGARIL